MGLKIYNTKARQKVDFTPLEPGKVTIYCCGVTVYDYCHLGHARSYIVWDVVRRYLTWRNLDVRYVQNFTDIDDKILRRAQAEHSSMGTVAERYIAAYREDMAQLNILAADAYPRATEVIPQIIALIQALIDQGYAYAIDGDVYYAVEKFSNYGQLSGRSLDQMEAGASGRVKDSEPKKRHPLDFALWKAAKPSELNAYTPWESPWGAGRPGWHIECSAMVKQTFGDTIDIHSGGMDLTFPHHENEIAQSEASTHKPLARYWMHNGFVNIQGEKMSKSLGNFTTIRDLLTQVEPMVIRLFVLQASYRKPIDFTDEAVTSAQNSWQTLREGLVFGDRWGETLMGNLLEPLASSQLDSGAIGQFNQAMDDDFNTPGGLAVLFELAKKLQKETNLLTHAGKTDTPVAVLKQTWQTLVALAEVLGLVALPPVAPDGATDSSNPGLTDLEIEDLIQQRQAARKAKNYGEGDRIRDQLQGLGITLIDQPGGKTTWHR
ncbi:MAG: cysteine--tRNA ligase [Oscillatoriales cyanobacterium RM2_1_1]|nr:cysteine--tRNA ligase [Oscillatoriales cyanobacterium SM2_3_0]NJO45071.1 cysteine--tRNA ligase [Oscillatoriales cyanobacterium RM2_1_1]